jgi:lysozyme
MGRQIIVWLAFLLICATASGQQFANRSDRYPPRSLIEEFGTPLAATPPLPARPVSDIAIALIKEFEGWDSAAYNDAVGYCTVGYGHLIALQRCETVKPGDLASITEEKGAALLEQDTLGARYAVSALVSVPLSDAQFGALVSFVFNVGRANFADSTLRRLLNAGSADLAAREFRRWVQADGKVLQGLVDRRSCEEALFRAQLALDDKGKLNRAQCAGLGAAPTAGPPIDIRAGER